MAENSVIPFLPEITRPPASKPSPAAAGAQAPTESSEDAPWRTAISMMDLGKELIEQGRAVEGRSRIRYALELLMEVDPCKRQSPFVQWAMAMAHRDVATSFLASKRYKDALPHLKAAVSILRGRIVGASHDGEPRVVLFTLLKMLGATMISGAIDDEALAIYEDAMSVFEEHATPNNKRIGVKRRYAVLQFTLGEALLNKDRFADAAAALDMAREFFSELFHRFPDNASVGKYLADTTARLAEARQGLDQTSLALSAYRQALTLYEALVNPTQNHLPDNDEYRQSLLATLARTAQLHKQTGEINLAIDNFARCVEIVEMQVADFPHDLAWQRRLYKALDELARVLVIADRNGQAIPLFKRALRIKKRLCATSPHDLMELRLSIIGSLQALVLLGVDPGS